MTDGLATPPLSTSAAAPSAEDRKARQRQKLEALRLAYAAELPGKILAIGDLWRGKDGGVDLFAILKTIRDTAHKLSGSAGTFGFQDVTERARGLEEVVDAALAETSLPLRDELIHAIDARVAAMREAGEAARSAPPPPSLSESSTAETLAVLREVAPPSHRIALIEAEPGSNVEIIAQLAYYGYEVKPLTGIAALGALLERERLAAVICDEVEPAEVAGITQGRDLPLIFLSLRGDLVSRLKAVRAGGKAYLMKPVNVGDLVGQLDNLTAVKSDDPFRVLIIDDDEDVAAFCEDVLQDAGMVTLSVTNPMDVVRPLSDFQPDIVLMDLYMPDCSGLDLAAVIRQQEAFVGIPIVFLSAERNLTKQLEAMRLGGDEFLTKPIEAPHLIAVVAARVERLRGLRGLMTRDSLTGLLNHSATRGQFGNLLSQSKRRNTPLTLAILDVDHFKKVNDTHGHPVGDHVLKSFARYIKQRFRASDVVGRVGGEEFIVVMNDVDGPTAAQVIDKVREGFSQVQHPTGDGKGTFNVTFSCGIASYPAFDGTTALTKAADDALYEAKRSGRNRAIRAETITRER